MNATTKQDILHNLDDLAARAQDMAAEVAELRRKLARGTRDIKPDKAAAAMKIAATPADVESVLRRRVATAAELASEIGTSTKIVELELERHRAKKRVVDLGSGRWSWVIGDETETAELNDLVVRLLEVRPMSFPEVIAATGAREKRVSGAIVRIQRDAKLSKRLVNRGTQNRALWFLKPSR